MKIGYYNCEIAECVTEKWEKKSEILPAQIAGKALLMSGQVKRYDLQIAAREVAQMEGNSFADAWTETMIADSLAQSYNHLWIVENEAGVTCGYLLANILGDETELLRIAVNPECRKDGIGQMLIDAYLAFARIDAVRGFLEVRHGNGAAKHLYEKNGYHLLACRKNYYKHPDEDADIYEIAFTENGE